MRNKKNNNQYLFKKTIFFTILGLIFATIYAMLYIKKTQSPISTTICGIFALAFSFIAIKNYWKTGETTSVILFIINHEKKEIVGVETTVGAAIEVIDKYKEKEELEIDYLGAKSFRKFIEEYNEEYSYELIDGFEAFLKLIKT